MEDKSIRNFIDINIFETKIFKMRKEIWKITRLPTKNELKLPSISRF